MAADLAGLVSGFLAALERRDFDRAMSFFVADPVWDMSAIGMGTFEGASAMRGLFEDWTGSYDEWQAELEDILELGCGVVVGVVREQGRVLGSTGRVQLRYAVVAVLAGGVIARVSSHRDVDDARAAAERVAEERR